MTHLKIYSQEMIYLNGVVFNKLNGIQDVHIKNISNDQYTITDENGFFKISSSIGDSLEISHISMRDLIIVLKETDLNRKPFIIEMNSSNLELDEVTITSKPKISTLSLGITSNEVILTPTERRLHTAGDFKPIHLLAILGGSLKIDPIINKISGKTKKIKKHIQIDQRKSNITFLKTNYYNYMLDDLKIKEEDIDRFLYYIVEETKIQSLLDDNNEDKLRFFIFEWWLKFQELKY